MGRVGFLNVTGAGGGEAASSAADVGNSWKRVHRTLTNAEDIRIMLCEPNSQLRMSLRMAFQGIGLRNVEAIDSLRGVETALGQDEIDLMIWDVECTGGDVCRLTRDVRGHRLGNNPFLPIITTTSEATPQRIKEIMNTGADDLIVKPLSTGFLFGRIMGMIERKRLFVVTSDYIGPERPNMKRNAHSPGQLREVPNPLRDRATGTEANASELQKSIDAATSGLNDRRMGQHSIRISNQVALIMPVYKNGEADESIVSHLDQLQFASEDLARRVTGTSYDFISSLTMAMVHVVRRIKLSPLDPDQKDVELLPELARAIKAAFDGADDAKDIAERISASVQNL